VWDTPPNYRNFPSGDGLPDTVKIWRIQNVAEKGKSSRGVVVSPYGIAENPNAEILAPGLSTSKEYGAVGVARYGHYLYWGYSGTPDVMTDAGKKFFVNCLYYMSEAGK